MSWKIKNFLVNPKKKTSMYSELYVLSTIWICLCRLVPNNHREEGKVFVFCLLQGVFIRVIYQWWDFYSVILFVTSMDYLMKIRERFSIIVHASYSIYEILTCTECCPGHWATRCFTCSGAPVAKCFTLQPYSLVEEPCKVR